MVRALAERDRGLDSMQTGAVMEYSSPRHHLKVREQLSVRRPQDLRIEAMSPLGVALVLVAKDSRLAIFRSSDNTLMRGAATADTLDRFARIPLAPTPAVDLLMGLSPDASVLPETPATAHSEDGLVVASWHLPDRGTLELGFSAGNLALVRRRSEDGQVDYKVHYADFRDIGGIMMAYQIEADFPPSQSRVKFRLERPLVNGAIADSTFELVPGPSTRQIDLDHQAFSSAAQ